jgi:clan AA aspartic protease
MITGTVNGFIEALIHLIVRGPQGQEQAIEGIVDTGFTGSLSLPRTLINALGLPFRRRSRAVLADGSSIQFDVHEAVVIWDGQPRRVPVSMADTDALIGTGLLHGHELTLQMVAGGSVTIRALP